MFDSSGERSRLHGSQHPNSQPCRTALMSSHIAGIDPNTTQPRDRVVIRMHHSRIIHFHTRRRDSLLVLHSFCHQTQCFDEGDGDRLLKVCAHRVQDTAIKRRRKSEHGLLATRPPPAVRNFRTAYLLAISLSSNRHHPAISIASHP